MLLQVLYSAATWRVLAHAHFMDQASLQGRSHAKQALVRALESLAHTGDVALKEYLSRAAGAVSSADAESSDQRRALGATLLSEFVRLLQQRVEVLVCLAQLLFAEGDLEASLRVLQLA